MKTMINGYQLRAEIEAMMLLTDMIRDLTEDDTWVDTEITAFKYCIRLIDEMLNAENDGKLVPEIGK